MIATTVTHRSNSAPSGLRPFSISKDTAQVLSLLRVAFGPVLDVEGRTRLDKSISVSRQTWHGASGFGRSTIEPGFVWEDDGRIVGNVSLLTSRLPGRYLVVNVAVHPDYRRRGIARKLMAAVLKTITAHDGSVLLLQVDQHNEPALELYRVLGFGDVGSVTTWKAGYSRLRQLPPAMVDRQPDRQDNFLLRPMHKNEFRQAYDLDQAVMNPDLDWPEPIDAAYYRQSLGRRLLNMFQARHEECWTISDGPGEKLLALGHIRSEWGRSHRLRLRVAPPMAGQLERPLLAKLVRRLEYQASRQVRIDHPAVDQPTNALLHEAGFSQVRTLTVMRYDF